MKFHRMQNFIRICTTGADPENLTGGRSIFCCFFPNYNADGIGVRTKYSKPAKRHLNDVSLVGR